MSNKLLYSIITIVILVLAVASSRFLLSQSSFSISGAPPYGESESDVPEDLNPYAWIRDWVRPDGPAKVGIQVGHLDSDQFPDELYRLRGNTGAQAGGYTEAEVNQAIAEELASVLRNSGVEVDIIPATVPPGYWADVFISIHADGSEDTSKSGYKFAGPWRDITGKRDQLVKLLEQEYQAATNLEFDPNITRNMRGYYAFSWWRYQHAIHPMTVAIIAETGFLTNPSDRELLTQSPEIPAGAMAQAILTHLESENLL